MKRTILLSLLLTLVLTMAKAYDEVAGFNGPTWYAYTENISEGNGSKSDPYLIKTAGQLAMLALEVNNGDSKEGKYYTIAADISLNKRAENLRVLWVPIGLDEDHPFSGTLTNPNGYSITGMMIDVSSVATTKYFGLFGYLKGTVDGIRIAGDSEIKLSDQGDYNAGLLCGYLDGGSYVKHCNIEDSYITGTKLDGSIYIGGLTGYNAQAAGDGSENGRTYSCVVKTTISLEGNGSSSITAGGVIGRSYGKVLDCHAVVDMTATSFSTSNESYLGGIIGRVDGGNLKYCSASGDIRAGVGSHAITGGAFGYVNSLYANSGKYRINIDYCVTTVAISGGHTLGGFIGYCYVGGSLYVDFTSDFSSSYIDACNASYAGGFIGELEYSKRITDGDNIWLSQAGTGNGFIGTMKKPTTVNYGVILGHTTRVPDANLKVLPANQSRFYYNGDMCNYQIVGDNRTIEKIDNYGGHIPDGDGYGIYGIVYGNGASLQNPGPAALNNEEPDDRLEMCNTDNYKLCAMLFYITNDKKTLYKGTDVTVDFSIEDIMNSTTGERVCQFTVPEDVTCVKVVDKHIYPLDPGEVVVTVKWNGLQRKVHLDITYGKDWTGGRNEAFEGGDGTQENPYLIHNADQLYSAVGSKNYNKKDVYFKLVCDIFFNTHLLQEDGTPRENAFKWNLYDHDFNANLDGNGKTIYGLYVNKDNLSQGETFGFFKNLYGTVKNLAIVDSEVSTNDASYADTSAGLLCGTMKEGASVTNCLFHGRVSVDSYCGGIAGYVENNNTSITDCFTSVHLTWPEKGKYPQGAGDVSYYTPATLERCISTGRVEKFGQDFGSSFNALDTKGCYFDIQMQAGIRNQSQYVQESARTTDELVNGNLMSDYSAWQQEEERYPMLRTFADTPYGKLLAMPIYFDIPETSTSCYTTDRAGDVQYIFEFSTEDVFWSAIHGDTYIDVINDCGAASIVQRTDDNVEVLMAEAQNVESQCTRARRTLPLNLRSGLTHFRFKDHVAQAAAEASFDKNQDKILTLRELVEANKEDFAVFNASAKANEDDLVAFPEFRYFTNTKTIEEGMLSGLDKLSELQLPKKLTTIAGNAFSGCASLEEITVPATFTTMNMGALYESSIKDILVNPKHKTMESIDGALFETDNIGKKHLVIYPPGRGEEDATISTLFHYINDYAFYKVPNLRNIYIDNCLPEGNMVEPEPSEQPIIHENEEEMMHIYVNDGSYMSSQTTGVYISGLLKQYQDDYFWGEYEDNGHLHIYYPLKVTEGGWATLYIGFPTQLPEGMMAYFVSKTNQDEKVATLKSIGRKIPAATPVVIKAEEPGLYPLYKYEGAAPDLMKYDNRLIGTYIGQTDNGKVKWGINVNQETSITGSVLTLGHNADKEVGFFKYNGTVVPPYRCYLSYDTIIEQNAKTGLLLLIDDTPAGIATDINRASSDKTQMTSDAWYTLEGVRLPGKPATKGFYIHNGKKMVLK